MNGCFSEFWIDLADRFSKWNVIVGLVLLVAAAVLVFASAPIVMHRRDAAMRARREAHSGSLPDGAPPEETALPQSLPDEEVAAPQSSSDEETAEPPKEPSAPASATGPADDADDEKRGKILLGCKLGGLGCALLGALLVCLF